MYRQKDQKFEARLATKPDLDSKKKKILHLPLPSFLHLYKTDNNIC
jgi:hypothetical protein